MCNLLVFSEQMTSEQGFLSHHAECRRQPGCTPVRERWSLRERGVAPLVRGADPPSRRCSCSAGMASRAPAAVPTRTSDRIGA
jgi:hypothetical protein